ncbi:MAG TPA: phosphatidate cytidylyltransferase [Limnobacter sp.]|uniref:phosphatidate cytidylyltransferase n=1 Tax=Limnobacter sp. TaxID=2003368 RepID=UPI002E339402|nr:phosphatidate cytidylyltransferase [Limnobacter sp.]HEX5484361.1 phosphatidate cytidylyltransferase [Limnobacter sp.]
MLMTRIATAVVLLIVLLAVLGWGGPTGWNGFVGITLLAAFWEWGRLGGLKSSQSLVYAVFSTALFGGLLYLSRSETLTFPILALAGVFWVSIAPFCLRQVSIKLISRPLVYLSLGLMLVCAAGLALGLAYTHGVVFLLSVVAICWVADVFAYVFGRLFGKRKLAPRVSPGKSWEGAIGGTVCVILLSWAVVSLAGHYTVLQDTWQFQAAQKFSPLLFSFWLAVLSAFSIVGDLFESLLKRNSGMKDSSQLLPGHGGVLDRIDAQLPVLPLAMLLLGAIGA